MNEQTIFSEVLERPSSERRAFLDGVCAADPAMRRRIEKLLAAHEDDLGFMGQPAGQLVGETRSEQIGTQVGRYKLREQIGEGGMGIVYVADQKEPVKRKVALKIIKPGMASKEVVHRFESERQALSMMDHPNIARVFDGGVTGSGQPYFVMELVQGVPVTQYCNEHRLTTDERLRLFVTICKAIQHAHQKGIIHRDIKPSNIIVAAIDGVAVPKVIDFGVAKAVGQSLTEETLYTQFTQMVGTPLYMSPEQTGLGVIDIDTRSDVYSLGVLLYELLTDRTPFASDTLKQAGFDEMRRMIREDDPPRPSDCVSTLNAGALSTVADQRASNARHLSNALKGELDWIVMKSLEKDRNRRYESASVFADDVERHLADEPIAARPTSTWCRVTKFARRNRTLVASSATVVITLALGLALSTTAFLHAVQQGKLAQQSSEQATQAEAEARVAERTAQQRASELAALLEEKEAVLKVVKQQHQDNRELVKLLSEMYPTPFLLVNPGKSRTIYEAIEEMTAQINDNGRLRGHPRVEIEVRKIFAGAYFSAREYGKFRAHLHRALALAEKEHGEDSLVIAGIHRDLAYEYATDSQMLDPKTVLEHAEEAIRIYGLHKKEEESFHAWVGKTHTLRDLGRLEEAKVAGEKSIELGKLVFTYPTWSYVDLAFVLTALGDLEQALVCCDKAIVNYELRGNPHGTALKANLLRHKARCLRRMYRLEEAQKTDREGYELVQTPDLLTEPQRHYTTLNLADVSFALGDVDEAFALVDEIERICRDNDGTTSLIECLDLKGAFYFQLGDYEAAAEVLEETTELASDRKMEPLFGRPCAQLALTYQALHQPERAKDKYKEVRPLTQHFVDNPRVHDFDFPYWIHAHGMLATSADNPQQLRRAEEIYQAAFDEVRGTKGLYNEAREAAYYVLHAIIERRQDPDPEHLKSIIEKLKNDLEKVTEPRATYGDVHGNQVPTDRWQVEAKLVELLLEDGQKDEAREVMEQALKVRRDAFDDTHIQTLLAQIRLGEFLLEQAEYEKAIAELEDAYEPLPGSPHLRGVRGKVAKRLVAAYEGLSKPAQAEQWRKTLEELFQDANAAPSARFQ